MNLIFYKKHSNKCFAIRPTQHCDKKEKHIWLDNETGEGGQFNADDVENIIYEALEKYFKENY